MTYKFLLTIFLTSLSLIGVLTPIAVAQERPKCYLIDNSGQLTDLTDICNASQKRSPETDPATSESQNIINNNNNISIDSQPLDPGLSVDDNVYILGDNNLPVESSFIDSSYYIDNGIGTNYTAYIRSYQVSPTSLVRETLREQVFQFGTYPNSITSTLRQGRGRVPFIIYRYQI
ncbi:hypothetical protein [Pleurocapsa sp. FMAR1]|uniref:hypothetical protein n=1 Tax=Pleurocapsa sp. FMAR1 TaxID=3040204 RepID=UPI0029C68588|nr:hypothetical protein [Pleurocapsa sp. FMAR1]